MKRFFTLIELLCVIAVIAILMGILLPALSSVKQKGKEAKARADMNSIVAACKAYEADYGVLPNPGVSSGDLILSPAASGSAATTYKTLFNILTGVTYQSSTPVAYNVRNIRYLEVPSTYAATGYVDPWNNTYGIALDLNYDGQLAIPAPASVTLNTSVATWSSGVSGSKYLYSWK